MHKKGGMLGSQTYTCAPTNPTKLLARTGVADRQKPEKSAEALGEFCSPTHRNSSDFWQGYGPSHRCSVVSFNRSSSVHGAPPHHGTADPRHGLVAPLKGPCPKRYLGSSCLLEGVVLWREEGASYEIGITYRTGLCHSRAGAQHQLL